MKSVYNLTGSIITLVLLLSVQTLAHNLVAVVPLGGNAKGDAATGDVVQGKTFSNATERGITGTRPLVPIAQTGIQRSDRSGDDYSRVIYYGEWVSPRFNPFLILSGGQYDNLTGLTWQTDPDSTARTWADAIDYCNNLVTGSIVTNDNWRLPNINELLSIIDRGQINPALPSGIFTLPANTWFWSATPYAVGTPSSLNAWAVNMANGEVDDLDKTTFPYAMCVTGQFKPLFVTPLTIQKGQE